MNVPAYAYARDSSQMQAEKGLSIPAQLEEIRSWAKEHGYEIIEEFVDDAYSGKDTDRPAFQQMLSRLKKKRCEAKAIVCWKSSRFARNVEHAAAFRGLLRRRGIELLAVAEPSVDGPTSVIVNTLLDAMNEFFSLQLAEDVLRGQKEAVRQGGAPGGVAPYGYRKERRDGHLAYVPQEEEAAVVKRIYRLYGEGMSMMDIATLLESEGIPGRRGGKWQSAYIRKILTVQQKIYLGCLVYGKTKQPKRGATHIKRQEKEWLVVENAHEPIISPDMADAANATRQDRPVWQNLNRNAGQSPPLLRGLLVCDQCGYRGTTTTSNGRRYYICSSRMLRKTKGLDIPEHGTPWLRQDLLDAKVTQEAKKHITGKIIFKIRRALEEEQGKENPKDEKTELEKQIRILKNKRARLVDAIADGVIRSMDAREKMEKISKHLDQLEVELEKQEEKPSPFTEIERAINEALCSEEGKAALALALIDHISFNWEEIVIHYKILFPEDRIQLRA